MATGVATDAALACVLMPTLKVKAANAPNTVFLVIFNMLNSYAFCFGD